MALTTPDSPYITIASDLKSDAPFSGSSLEAWTISESITTAEKALANEARKSRPEASP